MNGESGIEGANELPRDPEEHRASAAAPGSDISPLATPGPVHLSVADLERSIDYYRAAVGLQVRERGRGRCSLGVDPTELLVLVEEPGARPSAGFTGLYHFALLVPQRADLARWLAHAARERVELTGVADHFVSEALYLSDPDGHGIEIYWDRPRQVWEGQVGSRLTTVPLDLRSLLSEVGDPNSQPFEGLPEGTVMGHVHLKVASIPETVAFYRDALGFALMARLGGSAAFLAAGGYHHHVGANTWESAGASPPPPGRASLLRATFLLPDRGEVEGVADRLLQAGREPRDREDGIEVSDPAGNPLLFTVPTS